MAAQKKRPPTPAEIEKGDRLRLLREHIGLTQDAVAERGGITRVQVSHVEHGVNRFTTSHMQESMALGLGVAVADLKAYFHGKASLQSLKLPKGKAPTRGRDTVERPGISEEDRRKAIELLVRRGRDLDRAQAIVKGIEGYESPRGDLPGVPQDPVERIVSFAELILDREDGVAPDASLGLSAPTKKRKTG